MKFKCTFLTVFFCFSFLNISAGSGYTDKDLFKKEACYSLIKRVVPSHADYFEVSYIPKEGNNDVFELEGKGKKIILRGNNGISVASALNYYLKNYTFSDISWNGINLNLPSALPAVPGKVRKVSPYKYRHYFNYCTFSYTAAWWGWERWQQEIDFMALNGINMPLAMTGQNSVWDRVYRSMGFTDKDMGMFFTGPAYFMWFWAGNLDAWGGPLPQSWMKSHEELQKKILARERELGMTPILPAFTGHVPSTFKDKFPDAKVIRTNWEGRFDDTFLLEPDDPMFIEIGEKFMKEQIKTFGTDHLYGADTFNEMIPPSNDSVYLNDISKAVYRSMAKGDPDAVWVMQGWLFVDKRSFWGPTQMKAYLNAVPDENLIVLDLWSEEHPVWNRTESFYGKPWIWCMLHNFGGRNSLFGHLLNLSEGPAKAMKSPDAGNMQGIGLVPEGIEQNPVVYALMLDHVWTDQAIDVDMWLSQYIKRRYGKSNANVERAWQILKNTVYSSEGSYETAIIARPTFEKDNNWASTYIPYDPSELLKAWDSMVASAEELGTNDCFQYDLVTVGRQVLANYATVIQQRFAKNFKSRNKYEFNKNTKEFIGLIEDMDRLMATRKDFLLGIWLEDAKRWGTNEAERRLFEKNARNQITLWGGKDAFLHEYANKHWSGLFNGFYKKRWEMFIEDTKMILQTGTEFDLDSFTRKVKDWEWEWVNSTELYPNKPQGDPAAVSIEMYKKYAEKIRADYKENPELTKFL